MFSVCTTFCALFFVCSFSFYLRGILVLLLCSIFSYRKTNVFSIPFFLYFSQDSSHFSLTDVQEMDAIVSSFNEFETKEAGPLILTWAVFLCLVSSLPGKEENSVLQVCGLKWHFLHCVLILWKLHLSTTPSSGDWSRWLCSSSFWSSIFKIFSWDPSEWLIKWVRCKLFLDKCILAQSLISSLDLFWTLLCDCENCRYFCKISCILFELIFLFCSVCL